MKHYIGIDLGTTNSAICSYDGTNIRIWKSPEQNDVTPSAIFIDRRGNRYYGSKAYNQAPYNPTNSATLFKRFMGTNVTLDFESADLSLTPEECSAEILKVLYGYLPEEIKNDPETATVITVPAAFNQMKKDATLHAAKLAGLNNVALMQEPVAAIMSAMRSSNHEGAFIIYDLGGGTFDVSVAESINGNVTLLAHGGIEMCGGRDIDRMLFNQVVIPWLNENFCLPKDFQTNRKYKTFCRIAQWATERSKIELSSVPVSSITLSEEEARTLDENGEEIYIDIELNREYIDKLISDIITETITVTRETLTKSGISANSIEKIIFIGGPTNYKPLRDKVASELAIPANIDMNPMTAVAEGASIFAESIEWNTSAHHRKPSNETLKTEVDISFKYTVRTPNDNAKIMCTFSNDLQGYTINIVSLDTGWSSGNAALHNKMVITIPLSQKGDNHFEISVLDEVGHPISLGTNKITITKTLATITSIPASHSIGIEIVDKIGGSSTLDFLVREGDSLPKKGSVTFKTAQTLKAGSNDSINIKLWEGNILSPITDNRFIGVLKIKGVDIDFGVVPTGADIECEFEMSDSGTINLTASIPCVGVSFTDHNFYSRQEGHINLEDAGSISDEGKLMLERIDNISEKVDDPMLMQVRNKAEFIANLKSNPSSDAEDIQKAHNDLLDIKKCINKIRQDNLRTIRQMELDECISVYNETIFSFASEAEKQAVDNLIHTAKLSIMRDDLNFNNIIDNIRSKFFAILIKQDWFVIECYNSAVSHPHNFVDREKYNQLKLLGDSAIVKNNITELRRILRELLIMQIQSGSGMDMFDAANIMRG